MLADEYSPSGASAAGVSGVCYAAAARAGGGTGKRRLHWGRAADQAGGALAPFYSARPANELR